MDNVPFEQLWQLLAPEGEFCRRRKVCLKRWETFSPQRQRMIYSILVTKLTNGDYVSPNPYFAIDDNDKPVFLTGNEQDRLREKGIPMVQVKYNGKFLICTRETMDLFNLEWSRDW